MVAADALMFVTVTPLGIPLWRSLSGEEAAVNMAGDA
jgi:hypothetical protein